MADKLLDDAALMRKAARLLRAEARDWKQFANGVTFKPRVDRLLDAARLLEARSNSSDGAKEAG